MSQRPDVFAFDHEAKGLRLTDNFPKSWPAELRAKVNRLAHQLAHTHTPAGRWIHWRICEVLLAHQAGIRGRGQAAAAELAAVADDLHLVDLLRDLDDRALREAEILGRRLGR